MSCNIIVIICNTKNIYLYGCRLFIFGTVCSRASISSTKHPKKWTQNQIKTHTADSVYNISCDILRVYKNVPCCISSELKLFNVEREWLFIMCSFMCSLFIFHRTPVSRTSLSLKQCENLDSWSFVLIFRMNVEWHCTDIHIMPFITSQEVGWWMWSRWSRAFYVKVVLRVSEFCIGVFSRPPKTRLTVWSIFSLF